MMYAATGFASSAKPSEYVQWLFTIGRCLGDASAIVPSAPGRLGNSRAPGNFTYGCTFIEHLVPFGDLFQLLF